MSLDGQTRGAAADQAVRNWTARMVAPGCDAGQGARASFVSKDFSLSPVPAEAVLHITAQGLYRAFVNGNRVGDDLLTPGWTCYDDRIDYQSYDIADLLRAGENRIEIWLGDGWHRSPLMWPDMQITNVWEIGSPPSPRSPRATPCLS